MKILKLWHINDFLYLKRRSNVLLIKCGTQRAVLIVTGFGVSDIRTIVEKSALLENECGNGSSVASTFPSNTFIAAVYRSSAKQTCRVLRSF